jgi:hypothetical protein
VPIDPPWVVAALATPPHAPEVQAILDEQNQSDEPKVARNFRMAYVATVTLQDGEGESLHTIRYGRMPKATWAVSRAGPRRHRDARAAARARGRVPHRRRERVVSTRRTNFAGESARRELAVRL